MKVSNFLKTLINHFKKNRFYYLVFFALLIPRTIGLGYDVWNIDARLWDLRSDNFVQALLRGDLNSTYQKYHPGVTVMWLSGFSKYLFYTLFSLVKGYSVTLEPGLVYSEHFYLKSFFAKFPLVLSISLIFTYSIALLKKIGASDRLLYFFLIVTSLEPFYLGVSRFYHLSGLESALSFLSILCAYTYYLSQKKKHLFFSGLSLGLAFLTKTSALIVLPFIFFIILLPAIQKLFKKNLEHFKEGFISILIFLIIFIFTVYAFFPAMWLHPFDVLKVMYKEGIVETGFSGGAGATFTQISEIFYLEKLFLRSTVVLIISFLASFALLHKERKKDLRSFLILCVAFIFYFNVVMIIPDKLKDRYLTTIYPFVFVLSSYGLYYLAKVSKKTKLLIMLLLVYYSLSIFSYFPNMSAYHTDALWGYRGINDINIIKNRGEFYVSAIRYLNKIDGDKAYERSVLVTSSQRDHSAAGYLGSVYVEEGTIWNGSNAYYYLINFTEEKELPSDRPCKYIRSFGPRFPFYFEYLKLYQCSNI